MKVGITGLKGFMGGHLASALFRKEENFEIIPFEDNYFDFQEKLYDFVTKCNIIIHLAAVNRHPDKEFIYKKNISLVEKLINALENTGSCPYVIFSSSIQEKLNNQYGKSKKEGRILLEKWAKRNNAKLTSLIIPNVFGPFSKPFYNSVIATFCYQLTHDEKPKINVDITIDIIYINDLVEFIYKVIKKKGNGDIKIPKITGRKKVSKILENLEYFKESYLKKSIIPALHNKFDLALFNTFRSFIEMEYFPLNLKTYTDERGYLFEIIKELTGGQSFLSFTNPGITRGNHYHIRKIERFCVIKGEAVIKMRRIIGTSEVISFKVRGERPVIIDIPVFYTHNITNTGKNELITLFWTNEIYNPKDSDTFYEKV